MGILPYPAAQNPPSRVNNKNFFSFSRLGITRRRRSFFLCVCVYFFYFWQPFQTLDTLYDTWMACTTLLALSFCFVIFSILFIEMFFLVLFYFSLSAGYYERLSLFFLPSPYFKTTKNGEEEMRNLVWRRLVKKKVNDGLRIHAAVNPAKFFSNLLDN